MLTQSIFPMFLVAGALAVTATISRGDSEIVIAIRYLQPTGTRRQHPRRKDLHHLPRQLKAPDRQNTKA
jgi:hypothetical protein